MSFLGFAPTMGHSQSPGRDLCAMVSVVIPTFNRSFQVVQAVRSVMMQRVAPLEIIVVDDGSTDDTLEALAVFQPPIKVVSQTHRGVSAARNRGIALCAHPWIAFLDSDDLWLPGKLRTQLDYLAQHPGVLICQTEEIWLRNGRRLNPKKYHKKPQGYCFEALVERCLISPSAVIVHRSVFEKVGGFDENLPACEDYDLWLRIGLRYFLGLVERPLVVKHGGHADQLSSTVPALDRFRLQALAGLLVRESLTPCQESCVRRALDRKVDIYVKGCMKRGKFEEAFSMRRWLDGIAPQKDIASHEG